MSAAKQNALLFALLFALLLAVHAGAALAVEFPETRSPGSVILGDPPVAPQPLEVAPLLRTDFSSR